MSALSRVVTWIIVNPSALSGNGLNLFCGSFFHYYFNFQISVDYGMLLLSP